MAHNVQPSVPSTAPSTLEGMSEPDQTAPKPAPEAAPKLAPEAAPRSSPRSVHWTTRLLHGRDSVAPAGTPADPASRASWASLNTSVDRGATVVFPGSAAVHEGPRPERDGWTYGLHGTPTTVELARRICALEGGRETTLLPSGQAAIALVNLALLSVGDHVLLPHTVYGPSDRLARAVLPRFGVEAEIYRATDPADLERRLRPNTRLVWCESPGSITMEVQDLPALAVAAHAAGATVAFDSTWSGGVLFDAFAHGADISVQALTKYAGGHSDLLLGSVTACDEALIDRLANLRGALGQAVSPDDCSLALRGLLTLPLRLRAVEASALDLARWLAGRPEIARVLHPALPSCPGHALWRRDFHGANGLFSVALRPGITFAEARAVVDRLRLFRQGYSWGGVHSLALNYDLRERERALPPATPADRYDWRLIRLQIGLEEVEDLRADLAQALDHLPPPS